MEKNKKLDESDIEKHNLRAAKYYKYLDQSTAPECENLYGLKQKDKLIDAKKIVKNGLRKASKKQGKASKKH